VFELGFVLYLLIVFGLGGLLLLGVVVYFVRELLVRSDRPAWSARSRPLKPVFVGAAILAVLLLSIPLRIVWVTRVGAIPGIYKADGVWGDATLNLRDDGTFIETWHFRNEFSGRAEGSGSGNGRWLDRGRDWLTRDIVLDPFTPLAAYNRGHAPYADSAIVAGYGGSTSIEVDLGADIAFFK
jgi:hypothetical protein